MRITQEQLDYLRSIAYKRSRAEIAYMFNEKYNQTRSVKAIGNVMSRNKIKNYMQGEKTRFKKGYKPWNKNKKGIMLSDGKTCFQENNTARRVPVGSEQRKGDFLLIKVANPDIWKYKHRHVWEQFNGEIPENHAVLFKDGNKHNCDIDNLFLSKRQVASSVARQNLQTDDPDLNLATHKAIELDLKVRELSK